MEEVGHRDGDPRNNDIDNLTIEAVDAFTLKQLAQARTVHEAGAAFRRSPVLDVDWILGSSKLPDLLATARAAVEDYLDAVQADRFELASIIKAQAETIRELQDLRQGTGE